MTLVIKASNINEAVSQALPLLLANGIPEMTRNGKCLVAPGPVITEYMNPCERVLFSPLRDANPFFHLMESLWMLAGRNDIKWPAFFNQRFMNYSDDGVTQHGAYGHRWRHWFEMDQLSLVIEELRKNKNTRRAVLAMWSPVGDLVPKVVTHSLHSSPSRIQEGTDRRITQFVGGLGGVDVPCNTHAYFDCRGGVVNMTVCCRSNDAIWGAYGANAVHFSILLEYVAAALDLPVGVYRQFSNNFHAYTDIYNEDALSRIAAEAWDTNYYGMESVYPFPMFNTDIKKWNDNLLAFLEEPASFRSYGDEFFTGVAAPMFRAWQERKNKAGNGRTIAETIVAEDWRKAALDWIDRRIQRSKS